LKSFEGRIKSAVFFPSREKVRHQIQLGRQFCETLQFAYYKDIEAG